MHKKHFPTNAHHYRQQRLTQETAVPMGNLSMPHVHITAQVNTHTVTTACGLLSQVTVWVDLTACGHQTGEVWLCPPHPFPKSCCSPCPSFGGRTLPLRGNSPRQFGKRLILKKKWRALCGVSKSNPSVKTVWQAPEEPRGQGTGNEKGEGDKSSSLSEVTKEHDIDLAACDTEALIKPIYPSGCYDDNWPSHRTVTLKLCSCPFQNC